MGIIKAICKKTEILIYSHSIVFEPENSFKEYVIIPFHFRVRVLQMVSYLLSIVKNFVACGFFYIQYSNTMVQLGEFKKGGIAQWQKAEH